MAVWMPVFGNVINGIGHALGYRNFETKDASRNIIPIGLWIVGEELHNNHHADPRSAKFRAKWYEFDIGWMYIQLLSALKLASVIYARDVSAREFADKYYVRATHAAASAKAAAWDAAANAKAAAFEAAASAGAVVHDAANVARAGARDAASAASAKAKDAANAARGAATAASSAAKDAATAAGAAAQAAITGRKTLPATD
jgi:hypothetical protein